MNRPLSRFPVAAAIALIAPASAVADASGLRDFDFLNGEWRIHNRQLKDRLAEHSEWLEYESTCSHWALMDGAANAEDYVLNKPGDPYRAVGLRVYDPKTRQWAIWWLDGRHPAGPLDPPVVGHFESGVGRFYSDYMQDGKSMRVRYVWSHITPTSARWEQATTADAGKTWKTDWIMEFQRAVDPAPTRATPPTTSTPDFNFLLGNWHVQHRYLRPNGEWADAEGTASERSAAGGAAVVEDNLIDVPSASYRAIGLRSYDPKTHEWAIWWFDGRDPHATVEPPVKGTFQNGIGTFYGETTVAGKPTRVRLIWSPLTSTSARWEQAYSPDRAGTWETNWVMSFQRKQ